jgi:hypothetical protein
MRRSLTFLAAALISICGSPSAQVVAAPWDLRTVSVPIFNQVVVFSIPNGWKPAHESKGAGHYLLEHIPAEQTVQNWRDMVTVQGFQGLATRANASPRGLLNLLASHIKAKCSTDFIGRALGDRKIDGADASIALIGCGRLAQDQPGGLKAGESEVAAYVAIKGSNDMYVVHKSFRGKPTSGDAFPAELLQLLVLSLQPIKLCDKGEDQAECWKRPQR